LSVKKVVIPAKAGIQITLLSIFGLTCSALEPGRLYSSGPKDKPAIALTFDDGPGPETEKFLDPLDKFDVKATFFMLGELVSLRPALANKVKERGHEIGSHTWKHTNYKARLKEIEQQLRKSPSPPFPGSPVRESETGKGRMGEVEIKEAAIQLIKEELRQDLRKTQDAIEKATGEKATLLRMPHGIDRPWIKDVAKEEGYVLVNWTYGSDWHNLPVEEMKEGYLKAIRPGAILLFHDGGRIREKSLVLTEFMIDKANKSHVLIQTVSHLLEIPADK